MRRTLALMGMAVVLAWGAPAAVRAEAPNPDHIVQVGAVAPDGLPYSYTRFYPSTLQVHRSETVEFQLPTGPHTADTQFHTVTFSPVDDEAQPGWFRPDEAPGTFAFNEPVLMGSGCGRGAEPACVLRDSEQFFSSGSPGDSAFSGRAFRVEVDAPTGSYQFRCLIHDGMLGTVEVVDDDVPLDNPTPEELAAEFEADTAATHALVAEKSKQQPPVVENGRRVWTVDAGVRTADLHVEVLAYFPGTVNIAAGDEVRFRAVEPHTVTFPAAIVGPTLGPTPVPFGTGGGSFLPSCDPDSPDGGAPGVLLAPVFGPCPAGSSFELMMPFWMMDGQHAPSDSVATAATIHNSGLLVQAEAPDFQRGLPKGSGRHFPSEFRAVFPALGAFPYGCSLHPAIGMRGGVTVR